MIIYDVSLNGMGVRSIGYCLMGLRIHMTGLRKPGSYDCTSEKIGCINRAGIRSVIMTTVSRANRLEVQGIIDEAVKAGVKIFAFSM